MLLRCGHHSKANPWSAETVCDCLQAVAIGAAIQAGLYDGLVSGVMVLDIWQASLMRAFATQQLDRAAGEPEGDVDEPLDGYAGEI